jgi:RNA polymerase sigma factor (TIGR02999 family)
VRTMSDVSRILSAVEQGDPHAAAELLPLVYKELRELAAAKLAQEKPGQTLDATALVHEAYVRLVDGAETRHWHGRGHFFAAAAEAIRWILIDQARHKASFKAGGQLRRHAFSEIEPALPGPNLDMLALDEALEHLEKTDPRAAAVVKLRFFAGLTTQEAADALSVSLATAENDWAYAKCYLRLQIAEPDSRV